MYIIKIGDHSIQIKTDSLRLLNFIQKNFQNNLSNPELIDLFITLHDGYGVPFVDYEVEVTSKSAHILFKRADYLIQVDPEYRSAEISVHNELALKHALMNLYSSFIVYHRWGLLIHSSCVKESDKAHIFAGPSGAGKSTVAKFSYPRELLSDEATIVKITSNETIVFNSPFRSELEMTCSKERLPLSSIQILIQAAQNKRTLLKKSDAYLHLIDKIFFWTNYDIETKKILQLITFLVANTPVYELHFEKKNTFWELIS